MAETVAAAVAAFAAVATGVGVTVGLTGIAATIAGTALIINSTIQNWNMLSSALGAKPKVSATASQLQTKVGAVTPRAIIMGRTAVAGTLLTPTPLKSGKDDRFASNFYALSHAGPSGVVESVQWGDDTVTFDGSGNAIGKYNDNMWLFQKNGDWNQTAISYAGHPVLGSSTPSAWDSTKRARGCLVVALVVRYAAKVLGGNMQTPLFVVDANAVALTDPRTGSAATTQAQRRNPAVWAYSWRLGWFQNSKRVIGMGQASGELHAAGYAYAANVADANGWTISGEATTADDRYAVESAILLAAASVPVERNGLQSVVTSALRSSVGTITSNDLRADPKWRYNTQQSSRPTAIQTRYRSESNRWQMVEGAEVTDASWLTQDAGREKRITVEYPYAGGGSAHVGHLAALDASNAREPLIFSLPCKQQARYAGFVGDAVTVSLPEIGLSSTKMVVVSRVVNPDGTVDYELLVETDAKYPFAAGKTSVAPSFTLQPGFDIFSVPQPGAAEWASVSAQITSGGTSLPIVRVTGSAADYSFCTGVVFKLRLNSGGSPWLVSEDAPPAATQHEFRGITNNTGYIVGIAYRGVTGVEGPVRELAAVGTGVFIADDTTNLRALPNLLPDAQFDRSGSNSSRTILTDTVPAQPTLSRQLDATLGAFTQIKTPAVAAISSGSFYGVALAPTQGAADAVPIPASRIGYRLQVSAIPASGTLTAAINDYFVRLMGFRETDGVWDTSIDIPLDQTDSSIQTVTGFTDSAVRRRWTIAAWVRVRPGVAIQVDLNVINPALFALPAGQTAIPPWVPSSNAAPRADVTAANIAAGIAGQGALATKSTITLGDVQNGTQPNNSTLNETSTGTITLTTSWGTISDTTVASWKGGLADVRWMLTGFIAARQVFLGPTPSVTSPKLVYARLLVDNVAVGPEIIAGGLVVIYDGTDFPEELSAPIQAVFQEAVAAGSNRNFKVQLRVSRDTLGLGPSRPGRMSVRECML